MEKDINKASSESLVESVDLHLNKKGESWDEDVTPDFHPFHDLYDLNGNKLHDGHANFLASISQPVQK